MHFVSTGYIQAYREDRTYVIFLMNVVTGRLDVYLLTNSGYAIDI